MAEHHGLLSMNIGLLYARVACCFGLLGFPGTYNRLITLLVVSLTGLVWLPPVSVGL